MPSTPSQPPTDLRTAVRGAVRETINATLSAWVEEITATELRSDEFRNTLRPLLTALVREELEAALKPHKNGRGKKGR